MSDEETLALGIVVVFGLIALALFFLPTFIAFRQDHRNRWVIFLINLVFGATVLGWVGALIWAMNKIDDPLKGGIKHDPQTHDPMV
jgi:cytochrome c biogenesis protein CcdA